MARPIGSPAPARLSGFSLTAARTGWVVVVALTLATTVAGFRHGLANIGLLGPDAVFLALAQAGISPSASVIIGLITPFVLVSVLALLLFVHRSHDPMALLFSLMLVTLWATITRGPFALVASAPRMGWIVSALFVVGFGGLVLVAALFPSGRFEPPWAVWPVSLAIASIGVFSVVGDLPAIIAMFPERPAHVSVGQWRLAIGAASPGVFALGLWLQVHRYRHVSGPTGRQQAKWAMLPLGVFLLHMLVLAILPPLLWGLEASAWAGWGQLSAVPVSLLFPLCVTAAIMRHRLYDIDRIISRTASYALLTGLLVVVYLGVVFALQQLLRPITGESQPAVAGATLAVAALFGPARRRVQAAVDRQFNRARYDAQRVVDDFRVRLRDEVDLDQLGTELVAAVHKTVEPAEVSVWLRPREAATRP